jgi:hypothetical protein
MEAWEVLLTDQVEDWYLTLAKDDPDSANIVGAAIDTLAQEGPTLGRPLVDRIKGSRHHHMKELRPGSSGNTEVRILFCFDPNRSAILLIAGDKNGQWKEWYTRNIPIADDLYDKHRQELKGQQ